MISLWLLNNSAQLFVFNISVSDLLVLVSLHSVLYTSNSILIDTLFFSSVL